MCGIAGVFNLRESVCASSVIVAMTDVIRHRGPDGEGYALFAEPRSAPVFRGGPDTPEATYTAHHRYVPVQGSFGGDSGRFAALGHRRLSIIDLSPAGHQPMCSADGRYTIVYNGEIYNYVELRDELEREGCVFVSTSDTEVILHAYRTRGRDCLNAFNGMFAFLLYDRVEGKLFAARDRFGVKPLYYWYSPDGLLAFASEIKAFTALPGWRSILNGPRGYDFLTTGLADHLADTLFAGVRQLRGGEFVEAPVEQLRDSLPVRRWYEAQPAAFAGDLCEATEAVRSLFIDSVRIRLRADVPVGTGLSGGLDSSSIVCVVSRLLEEQNGRSSQNTFSACSSIERFDERNFIDVVVNRTGVAPHYTYPSLDKLFDVLPEITWHQDEPFSSTSIYAEWSVFDLVQQTDVRVTLDGHGSDELLAGYHSFFGPHLTGLLRGLQLQRLARELSAARRLHGYGPAVTLRMMASVALPHALLQRVRRMIGLNGIPPSWLNARRLSTEPYDPMTRFGARATSLNSYSLSQLNYTSLPVQLHWSDRDSMAHSIESRAPFLDYRLVELLLSLPEQFKLAEGVTKKVFREAMSGILPNQIRDRVDKMGFVTPEDLWIRSDQAHFRAALVRAVDRTEGVIDRSVLDLYDSLQTNPRQSSTWVWRVVSFAAWLERFGVDLAA